MLPNLVSPYQSPIGSPYAMPFARSAGGHLSPSELRMPHREESELIWPWEHSGEPSPDFLCSIFHGRRGKGKSTGATAFAKYLKDTNVRLDSNYKVYTNYRVNFANMAHPRLVDALITFPEWLKKCIILVDEIAVYFPSLRATSTNALNFSTFLQEIRKLEVDLIFTTQFPTMIIGNASIQIDLFIEPWLYHPVYEPRIGRMVYDRLLMNCCDWWGQWTGEPVRHRWPPLHDDIIARPKLINLKSIYSQFNTKEIIPAFWHPSRDNIMQREWAEEENQADLQEQENLAKQAGFLTKTQKVAPKFHTMNDLLDAQPDFLRLSTILREAQKIDPKIKQFAHLATLMRGTGWTCYQEGGKYGEWTAERIKAVVEE